MIKSLRLLALTAAFVIAGCSDNDGDARAAIANSSESSADPTETARSGADDDDAGGAAADVDGSEETTISDPETSAGDDEAPAAGDASLQDSSSQDSSLQDTSPQDTSLQDTSPQDSSPQDTSPQDTSPQDTESGASDNEPGQDDICAALAELDDAGEKLSAVSDDDRDGLEQGFADFAAALERVDGASADFPELSPYSKTLVSATAEVIVILEKVDYDGVAAATDPAFEAAASDPAATEAGDRIAEFSKDRCGVEL